MSPIVAPTTAPKEPSGSAPALSARAAAPAPCPATVRPSPVRACWTSGPSVLEVRASTNRPAPWRRRASTHRVERAEAEVRAGGDRVDGRAASGVEVGVGVGLAGRADVAALDVEQHQRAGRAGLGDDPLEDGDPPAAEALEERRLRLDHRHDRRDRLHRGQREPLQRRPTSSARPHSSSSAGVRVDPDAEAARAPRSRGPGGCRRRRHRVSSGRASGRGERRPAGGPRWSGRGAARCRPARHSRRRRGRRWPSAGRARRRTR